MSLQGDEVEKNQVDSGNRSLRSVQILSFLFLKVIRKMKIKMMVDDDSLRRVLLEELKLNS
jgi:hypothetical protein